MSLTIATVLKSGGDYDASYVNHIANSIKRYVTIPYEFVCLTDTTDGFCENVHKIIHFDNDLPKWWGKLELFKPNQFSTERVFYLDLDTIIVDNIDDIAGYSGRCFGLKDFGNMHSFASGLMAWNASDSSMHLIYNKFISNIRYNIVNHRYGDQEFIGNILGKHVDFAQELYPGKIVSYKHHCLDPYKNVYIPDRVSIICFHGKPRPHEVNSPVIQEYWRG